jgi:hypothetical protein
VGAKSVGLCLGIMSGLLLACGQDDAGDTPGTNAPATTTTTAPAAQPQAVEEATTPQVDSEPAIDETSLSRETFSYGGGSRDPFESLLNMDRLGPELSDLELVGVYLDPNRSSNSVAVLRDKSTGRPYKVRRGEEIGRARVRQIRQRDVTFTIEDFGFERQETLSLPTREDATP